MGWFGNQPHGWHYVTVDEATEDQSDMRPYLFLDTEWANDVTRELVSLAMTNSDGSLRFYAERDPLPSVPSTFVARVVYPLLERGSSALPDAKFGIAFRNYLCRFDSPIVLCDAPIDRIQLVRALTGFGQLMHEAPMVETMLVTRVDVLNRLEDYFSGNPDMSSRRHHAAVDAEALRCAFMSVVIKSG